MSAKHWAVIALFFLVLGAACFVCLKSAFEMSAAITVGEHLQARIYEIREPRGGRPTGYLGAVVSIYPRGTQTEFMAIPGLVTGQTIDIFEFAGADVPGFNGRPSFFFIARNLLLTVAILLFTLRLLIMLFARLETRNFLAGLWMFRAALGCWALFAMSVSYVAFDLGYSTSGFAPLLLAACLAALAAMAKPGMRKKV